MNTQLWQVVRDDAKRTFEVIGMDSDVNHFTNQVHGMQRAGMNVSSMTPPVTNKFSNKNSIVYTGYVPEAGLYQRLLTEYMKRTRAGFFDE